MVAAQVITQAPDYDGGMVAVALDHLPHLLLQILHQGSRETLRVDRSYVILDRRIDVNLDIGNLFPSHDSQPVAFRKNGRVLRVMRRAQEVRPHAFDQLHIPLAHCLRHSIAQEAVVLPPVDPVQVNGLPVQDKSDCRIDAYEANTKLGYVSVGVTGRRLKPGSRPDRGTVSPETTGEHLAARLSLLIEFLFFAGPIGRAGLECGDGLVAVVHDQCLQISV